MVSSDPIPPDPGDTDWRRSHSAEVLPQGEGSEPHVRLPSLGCLAPGKAPRALGFEDQWGRSARSHRTEGETETPLLEPAPGLTFDPGQAIIGAW